MGFYDNYLKRGKTTKIGKIINRINNNYYFTLIDKHLSERESKASVLEIGPGKGFFGIACKSKGFHYTAVEANEEIANALLQKGLNVYKKSVPPIETNQKYDIIVMNHVLEHMESRGQVFSLFENFKQILTPGGILIVTVPDITFWKADFFGSDYTHNFPFSLYSLCQVFIDSGFKVQFAGVKTLIFKGRFLANLIWCITKTSNCLGLVKLFFRSRAYKIKNLGNASCVVVGKNAK